MNLWVDMTNSPHVQFFARMIRELSLRNEIVLTSRPLANTLELLEMECFEHTPIGSHRGAGKLAKIHGFFERVSLLERFLRDREIDAAISQSSYYSPLAAHRLGIPVIYLNDNEHALGNWVSFYYADLVLLPEHLGELSRRRRWHWLSRCETYPGLKEGVYLWKYLEAPIPRTRSERSRPTVFVRPEPWLAQYYSGRVNFLDHLLSQLGARFRVVVLPRGGTQSDYYKAGALEGVEVLEGSMALEQIIAECDLFIGAGGTMTREVAVLGVPTISVYQDDLLRVDRYLLDRGAMVHLPQPTLRAVLDFYESTPRTGPNVELLEKGRAAYHLIRDRLLDLADRKQRLAPRKKAA